MSPEEERRIRLAYYQNQLKQLEIAKQEHENRLQLYNDIGNGILDFVPGIGEYRSMTRYQEALNRGDNEAAAKEAAGMVAGQLPGGRLYKSLIELLKRGK